MQQNPQNIDALSLPSRAKVAPWRWGLLLLGLFCFALGFVGAVVPGMPTTIFLLIGSFCLTRSCPWLEEKLLNNRLFAPYAKFIRSREPMSRSMRWTAIGLMSLSVCVSALILFVSDRLTITLAIVFSTLWVIGFVSILLFRRGEAKRA